LVDVTVGERVDASSLVYSVIGKPIKIRQQVRFGLPPVDACRFHFKFCLLQHEVLFQGSVYGLLKREHALRMGCSGYKKEK
jgi:hypothetical protein